MEKTFSHTSCYFHLSWRFSSSDILCFMYASQNDLRKLFYWGTQGMLRLLMLPQLPRPEIILMCHTTADCVICPVFLNSFIQIKDVHHIFLWTSSILSVFFKKNHLNALYILINLFRIDLRTMHFQQRAAFYVVLFCGFISQTQNIKHCSEPSLCSIYSKPG